MTKDEFVKFFRNKDFKGLVIKGRYDLSQINANYDPAAVHFPTDSDKPCKSVFSEEFGDWPRLIDLLTDQDESKANCDSDELCIIVCISCVDIAGHPIMIGTEDSVATDKLTVALANAGSTDNRNYVLVDIYPGKTYEVDLQKYKF